MSESSWCEQRRALLDEALADDRRRGNDTRIRAIGDAAAVIAEVSGVARHDLFVMCGSGLAHCLDEFECVASIPIAQLGVPVPAAEGHGGEVKSLVVELEDGRTVHVLVATGRIHLYEGYDPRDVVQLSRVAAMTGVRAAVLTNASGCLRQWNLGDVVAITDHINLSGRSPFTGPVFTDIARVWDGELIEACTDAQRRGVYAICSGPEFQTLAESRMMRDAFGVDIVGMSTIMEAIALHQMEVRVAGLSVVADLSFAETPCVHEQVLRAVEGANPTVARCIAAIAAKV